MKIGWSGLFKNWFQKFIKSVSSSIFYNILFLFDSFKSAKFCSFLFAASIYVSLSLSLLVKVLFVFSCSIQLWDFLFTYFNQFIFLVLVKCTMFFSCSSLPISVSQKPLNLLLTFVYNLVFIADLSNTQNLSRQ